MRIEEYLCSYPGGTPLKISNAGQNKKALDLALKATDSKVLQPKVEELINKIKEKITQKGNKASSRLYSLWEQ